LIGTCDIRETSSEENCKVLALYPLAFPEEELRPVVTALLEGKDDVLSIAAFEGENLVAHVLFTLFGGEGVRDKCALLGPLGVVPSHQRKGLGSLVVRAGLERLDKMGVGAIFVLGDPAYYHRFGFKPERLVLAPYPMPVEYADAWQSMKRSPQARLKAGPIVLPDPWMDPALWSA